MRIPEEEVQFAVQAWGYTPREARFLWIVTGFSGHFIREQYARFAEVGRGRPDHDLAEKLLTTGHCPAAYAWGNRQRTQRFHVQGRPLYRAFGRENSNHRKATTSNSTIAVRIAALDFVLGELEARYFLTVEERLAYLRETHGVTDPALIPTRAYPARGARGTTPAQVVAFPDRVPMSVRDDGTVTFSYVDAPDDGLQPFETHVARYAPLLSALRTSYRFVFVSGIRPKIERAESVFRAGLSQADEPLTPELLRYFSLEDRFLRQDFEGMRKRDFDERVDLAKKYEAPAYQKLFPRWRAGQVHASRSTSVPRNEGSFEGVYACSLDC